MASLWKRSNSPYWVACFTSGDGKRLKKSTKQRDRRKALSISIDWERVAEQARQKTLTETQARRVVSDIVERATGEPVLFHTSEEWFLTWLADKKKSKARGTFLKYEFTILAFLEHLGSKAKRSLACITPKDIQTFRDGQVEAGKSTHTANLAVKHIRIPLNVARRHGIIPNNPAEAVDTLPVQRAEKGVFTPKQLSSLLREADADWRGVILFGFYTGARLRDITEMRWQAVDLSEGLVRFIPRKTGSRVIVPLHPSLEDYLITLPVPTSEQAFVFPNLAGRGTGGAHGLSSTFNEIMKKAKMKVDIAEKRRGVGRRVSSLSFHSLRHTFNSMMANKGVTQELRQKLTGHASAEINRSYTHHELEPLRAAVEMIPRIEVGAEE